MAIALASIDEEDRYGGSVTLDAGLQMKPFHNGQLVKVDGTVVDKESREPSPVYHVKDIALVK